MSVLIANASRDERGKYAGGKPGDQDGSYVGTEKQHRARQDHGDGGCQQIQQIKKFLFFHKVHLFQLYIITEI